MVRAQVRAGAYNTLDVASKAAIIVAALAGSFAIKMLFDEQITSRHERAANSSAILQIQKDQNQQSHELSGLKGGIDFAKGVLGGMAAAAATDRKDSLEATQKIYAAVARLEAMVEKLAVTDLPNGDRLLAVAYRMVEHEIPAVVADAEADP